MSEMQTVELRFRGERLGSYTDEGGTTWTLYSLDRSCDDDGLYRIHASDEEGAWVESELEASQVLRDWPELAYALLS